MNSEPAPHRLDTPPDTNTLDYFTSLIDDERIDSLLDTGERSTQFTFDSMPTLDIHPRLPKNYITDEAEHVAALQASGSLTTTADTLALRLDLKSTEGLPFRHLTIIQDSLTPGGPYLYDNMATEPYIEPLTLKAFGDLALRIGNLTPNRVYRDLARRGDNAQPPTQQSVFKFLCELAQKQAGTVSSTGVATKTFTADNDTEIEARFAIVERELPTVSERDLTIEHATVMTALDAEIIYRLELSYQSDVSHTQQLNAEKRVISGCEPQLTRARLTSRDKEGRITPLDVANTEIMKNFEATVEAMLQNN